MADHASATVQLLAQQVRPVYLREAGHDLAVVDQVGVGLGPGGLPVPLAQAGDVAAGPAGVGGPVEVGVAPPGQQRLPLPRHAEVAGGPGVLRHPRVARGGGHQGDGPAHAAARIEQTSTLRAPGRRAGSFST